MIKFINKTTVEYTVMTKEDVDTLEEELRADADKKGYQLAGYSWSEKFVKSQGEIIDNYFVVKASSVMNDAKDPESPIRLEFIIPEVPAEMEGF